MAGNIRALVAELVGTFGWVLFVAGAACADALAGGRLGPGGQALAQGLAVAGVYGVFGRYSAGLFNPAFTAALVAARRLDWVKAALCLLCQLLGAALAGLFLATIFGAADRPPFLGAVVPSLDFRAATLVEAVLAFFLAAAARTASQDRRLGGGALTVGAVAAAASLVGGPLTGAAMNPARAFGPAVASGLWRMHYVYWVGPLAGAMAGIWLARLYEKDSTGG